MVKTPKGGSSFGICELIFSVLNICDMCYYGAIRVVLSRFYFPNFNLCVWFTIKGTAISLPWPLMGHFFFFLITLIQCSSFHHGFIKSWYNKVIRCKCDKHADGTRILDMWQETLVTQRETRLSFLFRLWTHHPVLANLFKLMELKIVVETVLWDLFKLGGGGMTHTKCRQCHSMGCGFLLDGKEKSCWVELFISCVNKMWRAAISSPCYDKL